MYTTIQGVDNITQVCLSGFNNGKCHKNRNNTEVMELVIKRERAKVLAQGKS